MMKTSDKIRIIKRLCTENNIKIKTSNIKDYLIEKGLDSFRKNKDVELQKLLIDLKENYEDGTINLKNINFKL